MFPSSLRRHPEFSTWKYFLALVTARALDESGNPSPVRRNAVREEHKNQRDRETLAESRGRAPPLIGWRCGQDQRYCSIKRLEIYRLVPQTLRLTRDLLNLRVECSAPFAAASCSRRSNCLQEGKADD